MLGPQVRDKTHGAGSGDVLCVQTLPSLAAALAKQWASWAREESLRGRHQHGLPVLAGEAGPGRLHRGLPVAAPPPAPSVTLATGFGPFLGGGSSVCAGGLGVLSLTNTPRLTAGPL